jgi:predicted Fe-Mo cluster-binding NifX family protein
MRVAITIWGKRISPVFDAAQKLLIAELGDGRQGRSSFLHCNCGQAPEIAKLLLDFEVQVLVTGAISREPAMTLENSGITLIPFISGRYDEVLEKLRCGASITCYRMPGWQGGKRCRKRRARASAETLITRTGDQGKHKRRY